MSNVTNLPSFPFTLVLAEPLQGDALRGCQTRAQAQALRSELEAQGVQVLRIEPEATKVIPRSQAEGLYDYQYAVQTRTLRGNWVTNLQTNHEESALSHADYLVMEHKHATQDVRILDNLA